MGSSFRKMCSHWQYTCFVYSERVKIDGPGQITWRYADQTLVESAGKREVPELRNIVIGFLLPPSETNDTPGLFCQPPWDRDNVTTEVMDSKIAEELHRRRNLVPRLASQDDTQQQTTAAEEDKKNTKTPGLDDTPQGVSGEGPSQNREKHIPTVKTEQGDPAHDELSEEKKNSDQVGSGSKLKGASKTLKGIFGRSKANKGATDDDSEDKHRSKTKTPSLDNPPQGVSGEGPSQNHERQQTTEKNQYDSASEDEKYGHDYTVRGATKKIKDWAKQIMKNKASTDESCELFFFVSPLYASYENGHFRLIFIDISNEIEVKADVNWRRIPPLEGLRDVCTHH